MGGRVTCVSPTEAFESYIETYSRAKICKECGEDVALASALGTRAKIAVWSLWLHNDGVVDVVLGCTISDHQNRIPFFSASAI